MPLLTNKDISLTVRGKLYRGCVQSSMLHESETWIVRKENEVELQQAEMRITHTHTQPFYGSVEFVRDHPGELAPGR